MVNAFLLLLFALALTVLGTSQSLPSLRELATLPRPWVWITLLTMTGAIQLYALTMRDYPLRIGAASMSVFLWTFTTIGALLAGSPTSAMFAFAALHIGWFVLVGARHE